MAVPVHAFLAVRVGGGSQAYITFNCFLSAKHFYVSDFPRERPYLLALGLLQILRILLL